MVNKRVKSLMLLIILTAGLFLMGCGGEKQEINAESVGTEMTEVCSSVEDNDPETKTDEETSDREEVETQTEPEVEEMEYYDAYESVNESALGNGFSMGAAFSANSLKYPAYKDMVARHFGSITATNEMKAYSLLDQSASKKSKDGMPVMKYDTADKIVAFAQENGLGVRGHVLVWDAYMCDWFFREGYSGNGEYVDQATMKARLEYYIDQVITHFEEKFPGVVYCWDVVNEAVGDNGSEYASGDARHVRTKRNGGANPFYQYVGEDYVELSFLYAKNTVEKLQRQNPDVDIKLFYNDYSTFYNQKRDAIIALVKSINCYAQNEDGTYRKLCDGVGMQSYIGGYGKQDGCMNSGDLGKIRTAIRMYSELGVEVHATELAVRNYKNDEATLKKHAEFYGKLFQLYAELNAEGTPVVTNVSIWGLQDNPYMKKEDYSYKMNGPYCGLFDENLCVKGAFREIYKVLGEK